MSKAVLILEMPDRCGHCRLAVMQRCYPICAVTGLECVEGGKPEWCPLRDLPEHKETDNMVTIMHDAEAANRSTLQQIGYNRGWNDCLDALEAEHEQPETVR